MFRKKTPRKPSNNSLGLLLLAAFVVFDAGLALLAWQRWQKGKLEERAVAEERELMVVGASEEPVVPRVTTVTPPPRRPLVGRDSKGRRMVARLGSYSPYRPDPGLLPQAGEGARPARGIAADPAAQTLDPAAQTLGPAAQTLGPAAQTLGPAARAHLPRATEFYRALKRQPRYRALVRAWTEEFVKHKELRALNHRYHQDRDAAAFILGAVRSPEFLKLLGAFMARADLQGFLRDMTGSADVSASAQALVKDGKVASALSAIQLPGLPPFSAIGAAASRR